MTTNPQRLLAYALVALGVFLLLLRLGGADWLWLALLGVVFLAAYASRRTYGFLVAGSVLVGLAVGTIFDTGGGMLLSLAAGFYAVHRVEPRPNRWALLTAGVLAALGVFVALGSFRLFDSVLFALALVGAGVFLLYRGDGPGSRPAAGDSSPSPYTDPPTTPTSQAPVTPEPVTTIPVTPAAPTFGAPADVPDVRTPDVSVSNGPMSNGPSPAPVGDRYRPDDVLADPTVTPLEPQPIAQPVTPPPPAPLSEAAQGRLGHLSAWRKRTAAAEGTPAYIVFSNDTLAKIAAAEPQTLDDLGQIRGVGPVKLSRYGEAVLGVLREDGLREDGLPENHGAST